MPAPITLQLALTGCVQLEGSFDEREDAGESVVCRLNGLIVLRLRGSDVMETKLLMDGLRPSERN